MLFVSLKPPPWAIYVDRSTADKPIFNVRALPVHLMGPLYEIRQKIWFP